MVPENITLAGAFIGGIVSFLSPCVLPMVPVYLGSLTGPGIFEARGIRLPVFLHSLSFVIGFSVIFVLLGAVVGLTGYALNPNYGLLSKIAGSLLIVFGLFILAAFKVPWLNFEKRLSPSLGNTTGYLRSFLIGAVFPLAWTACVAPILGSILTIAAFPASAWQGAYLLAVYSLGLGLPFLIIGFAFDSFLPWLKRLQRYSGVIHIISGLLLIVVGMLFLTGIMNRLLSFAS
ncbi:cytochrome c biogenesis CcdA family protein [Chloroflexota bacterium]